MITNLSSTDDELLLRLRNGDENAFSLIYTSHWDSIFQAAYNRLRNKEECRDIVQNVFISLWNRREQVVIKDLKAYLFTSVRYQVIRYTTRKPADSEFLDSFQHMISSPYKSDDLIMEKDIQHIITLYIQTLPKKRRVIFNLYYIENQSTAQIAEQLNISRKTVQNQLHTVNNDLRLRITRLMTLAIASSFLLPR